MSTGARIKIAMQGMTGKVFVDGVELKNILRIRFRATPHAVPTLHVVLWANEVAIEASEAKVVREEGP